MTEVVVEKMTPIFDKEVLETLSMEDPISLIKKKLRKKVVIIKQSANDLQLKNEINKIHF
jgi:hypothetical protein